MRQTCIRIGNLELQFKPPDLNKIHGIQTLILDHITRIIKNNTNNTNHDFSKCWFFTEVTREINLYDHYQILFLEYINLLQSIWI